MAERRMFSKKIINSARFLKMPVSTQCLYFHLGVHADDDGIVEAYTVMNSIGATEDELKILVAKQFVIILNEDLVSYLVDWKENNKIRADRKVDSIYKDLLLQILPNADLLEKKPRTDRLPIQENEIGTSQGQPMDGIGKDRLGKDSIGKDSINFNTPASEEKSSSASAKANKHKYGEYKNVLLKDEELQKLQKDYQNWEELIRYLDEYIEMKGYKAKSHYLAIKKWVADAVKREARAQKNKTDREDFLNG